MTKVVKASLSSRIVRKPHSSFVGLNCIYSQNVKKKKKEFRGFGHGVDLEIRVVYSIWLKLLTLKLFKFHREWQKALANSK